MKRKIQRIAVDLIYKGVSYLPDLALFIVLIASITFSINIINDIQENRDRIIENTEMIIESNNIIILLHEEVEDMRDFREEFPVYNSLTREWSA